MISHSTPRRCAASSLHRMVQGRLCTCTELQGRASSGTMDKRPTAAESQGETSNTAKRNFMYKLQSGSVTRGAGKGQMPPQHRGEDCWEQDAKWDNPERSKQGKSLRGRTTGTHAQTTGRGKGRERKGQRAATPSTQPEHTKTQSQMI